MAIEEKQEINDAERKRLNSKIEVSEASKPEPLLQGTDKHESDSKAKRQDHPKSLHELAQESNNADAQAIDNDIAKLKKDRTEILNNLFQYGRKLRYKETEKQAVEQLLKMASASEESINDRKRQLLKLKRARGKLEFMISTEAKSLDDEKNLIRKISSVNKDLNEVYKYFRLEKKSKLINQDIEDYKAKINESKKALDEINAKLDDSYAKLRKVLGINHSKERRESENKGKPYKRNNSDEQEKRAPVIENVNLEDIAVIKKKKVKE
ncbi:MAG: hypothetical protein ACP5RP_04250 [Candidatus Micrarchaeia archaeon]